MRTNLPYQDGQYRLPEEVVVLTPPDTLANGALFRCKLGVFVTWLREVESYLKDAGMAGLASAWAMARRRPNEYRR